MAKQGFRSNGDTPYVYQEAGGSSIAFGLDSSDSNKFKAVTAPSTNILPTGLTPNIEIDPAMNGDATFRANGTGDINLVSANIVTTGGILQADIGTGRITIASGGGGITTLDGNTGSATGSTVTVETAHTNVQFVGSGSTLTQDFAATTNLALGSSLPSLAGGTDNTAYGVGALASITSGTTNTAIGKRALFSVTDSVDNVCIGASAGLSLDANYNVLVGAGAGQLLSTGTENTIVGHFAADTLRTGLNNTIIGESAGNNYVGAESRNVLLNSLGVASENFTLHIGDSTGSSTQNQLQAAFICGIQTIVVTGTAVLVSSSDQLGVAASSQRFKSDVQDMGSSSGDIYNLRPVTFVWDKTSSPGLKDAPSDRQFGLIAEEVALDMPHLVGLDKDNKPFNVHYERLIPMLLNEIQRLEKRIKALEER